MTGNITGITMVEDRNGEESRVVTASISSGGGLVVCGVDAEQG